MLTLHLTLILTLTLILILTLRLTLTLSERNVFLWRPVNYNLAPVIITSNIKPFFCTAGSSPFSYLSHPTKG